MIFYGISRLTPKTANYNNIFPHQLDMELVFVSPFNACTLQQTRLSKFQFSSAPNSRQRGSGLCKRCQLLSRSEKIKFLTWFINSRSWNYKRIKARDKLSTYALISLLMFFTNVTKTFSLL